VATSAWRREALSGGDGEVGWARVCSGVTQRGGEGEGGGGQGLLAAADFVGG
jgi:hypothetical protein